ncbi:MAG: hypothetical protein LBC92_03800 [Rickettsiales bacterium]|jgi:hypothetical protein|nr:hypothetical protein [Rickettsiales bacterium]
MSNELKTPLIDKNKNSIGGNGGSSGSNSSNNKNMSKDHMEKIKLAKDFIKSMRKNPNIIYYRTKEVDIGKECLKYLKENYYDTDYVNALKEINSENPSYWEHRDKWDRSYLKNTNYHYVMAASLDELKSLTRDYINKIMNYNVFLGNDSKGYFAFCMLKEYGNKEFIKECIDNFNEEEYKMMSDTAARRDYSSYIDSQVRTQFETICEKDIRIKFLNEHPNILRMEKEKYNYRHNDGYSKKGGSVIEINDNFSLVSKLSVDKLKFIAEKYIKECISGAMPSNGSVGYFAVCILQSYGEVEYIDDCINRLITEKKSRNNGVWKIEELIKEFIGEHKLKQEQEDLLYSESYYKHNNNSISNSISKFSLDKLTLDELKSLAEDYIKQSVNGVVPSNDSAGYFAVCILQSYGEGKINCSKRIGCGESEFIYNCVNKIIEEKSPRGVTSWKTELIIKEFIGKHYLNEEQKRELQSRFLLECVTESKPSYDDNCFMKLKFLQETPGDGSRKFIVSSDIDFESSIKHNNGNIVITPQNANAPERNSGYYSDENFGLSDDKLSLAKEYIDYAIRGVRLSEDSEKSIAFRAFQKYHPEQIIDYIKNYECRVSYYLKDKKCYYHVNRSRFKEQLLLEVDINDRIADIYDLYDGDISGYLSAVSPTTFGLPLQKGIVEGGRCLSSGIYNSKYYDENTYLLYSMFEFANNPNFISGNNKICETYKKIWEEVRNGGFYHNFLSIEQQLIENGLINSKEKQSKRFQLYINDAYDKICQKQEIIRKEFLLSYIGMMVEGIITKGDFAYCSDLYLEKARVAKKELMELKQKYPDIDVSKTLLDIELKKTCNKLNIDINKGEEMLSHYFSISHLTNCLIHLDGIRIDKSKEFDFINDYLYGNAVCSYKKDCLVSNVYDTYNNKEWAAALNNIYLNEKTLFFKHEEENKKKYSNLDRYIENSATFLSSRYFVYHLLSKALIMSDDERFEQYDLSKEISGGISMLTLGLSIRGIANKLKYLKNKSITSNSIFKSALESDIEIHEGGEGMMRNNDYYIGIVARVIRDLSNNGIVIGECNVNEITEQQFDDICNRIEKVSQKCLCIAKQQSELFNNKSSRNLTSQSQTAVYSANNKNMTITRAEANDSHGKAEQMTTRKSQSSSPIESEIKIKNNNPFVFEEDEENDKSLSNSDKFKQIVARDDKKKQQEQQLLQRSIPPK